MARFCLAIALAASGRARLAAAQAWFHQAEHPGPIGDLTAAEREAIWRVDPGIEGAPRAVGSANTQYWKLLLAHGAETNIGYRELPSSEWEAAAGVKILNSTPFNVSGARVVRTDHGLMPVPVASLQVAWKLEERPRRMALFVIEMIEDYRPYLGQLVPQVRSLLHEFRAQGLPVFFSNWVRRPSDGLYGGLDRAMGYGGLADGTNGAYTYKEHPVGLRPMRELMPTEEEVSSGHFIRSIHLDKFADLDADGRSILADKLHGLGVDTLLIVGGWTDACVIATALDAMDTKNLDVIMVSDAVGTANAGQQAVLSAFRGMFGEQDTTTMLSYLQEHKGDTSYLLAPLAPEPAEGGLARFGLAGHMPLWQALAIALPLLVAGALIATLPPVKASVAAAFRGLSGRSSWKGSYSEPLCTPREQV